MAAMVLSSPQAVQMSVFVVQAFVAMFNLSPPQVAEAEEPPRSHIGFTVRERRVGYRTPSTKPPAKSRQLSVCFAQSARRYAEKEEGV
jgi:hypothetical protein